MKEKNVLIFLAHVDNMGIDEAVVRYHQGWTVYLLLCDKSVGVCHFTPMVCGAKCDFCHYVMKKKVQDLVKKYPEIHFVEMAELMPSEMLERIEKQQFSYENTTELKAIRYKNVDIGFGAFSTYATATRNIMPTYNPFFHNYIDFVMRREMRITDTLLTFLEKIHIDCIVFHNGRFCQFKPFHNIAQHFGIEYMATELFYDENGNMRKDYYYNDIPLSYRGMTQKMIDGWNNGVSDKVNISEQFFINRRNSVFAGDKIYTKSQVQGLLPNDFDAAKRNIVIFNSSEDEFFSVSKECDNAVLFPNQYIALTHILDHYKGDKTVHFYLRVHPNLKSVPWKSHTLLYELQYDNLTIIPPDSPISSYALMDIADKIIVFNSTMGVESSYWQKPVIALSECFYTALDIVYTPNSEMEVYQLLDNPHLSPKNRENCLKAAYFLMGYVTEPLEYYPNRSKILNFAGHLINKQSQFKFMNSSFLHGLIELLLYGYEKIDSRFKDLANKTA